jgi:predicted RNase H-like HicB family nuclease
MSAQPCDQIAEMQPSISRRTRLKRKFKMVYWKGQKFWVGKLVDHPDVMTQGRTLKELEENIIDAYKILILDEVPEDHETKRVVVAL